MTELEFINKELAEVESKLSLPEYQQAYRVRSCLWSYQAALHKQRESIVYANTSDVVRKRHAEGQWKLFPGKYQTLDKNTGELRAWGGSGYCVSIPPECSGMLPEMPHGTIL